jgi:methylmalonyl-CoA carboxyltransferase large subunit
MSRHDLKSLEARMEELAARIEKLESLVAAAFTKNASPLEATKAQEPVGQKEIPEEIILAISAAVAAFLGKRASIRQIRLTGETPWAMQGRATVQASHGMEFVRGRR